MSLDFNSQFEVINLWFKSLYLSYIIVPLFPHTCPTNQASHSLNNCTLQFCFLDIFSPTKNIYLKSITKQLLLLFAFHSVSLFLLLLLLLFHIMLTYIPQQPSRDFYLVGNDKLRGEKKVHLFFISINILWLFVFETIFIALLTISKTDLN